MRSALFLTLLSMLFAFGCANETGDPTDDPMLGDDDDDDGNVGVTCESVVPNSNFDVIVGSNLNPFVLPQCGQDADFDIYGDSFCRVEGEELVRPKATFVGMAAGWCRPCRIETEALVDGIARDYEPRGIRFVQVVIHDNTFGNPADAAFCEGWVAEYNPSYPTLLNTPLVDVEANVLKGEALPFSLIIDQNGKIIEIEEGFNETALRASLDAALELADEE